MSIVRPRLTRPESGARSPVSSRSSVVLPAPLMPIRPIRSPGPIDQDRSEIRVRSGNAYGHVGQVEHVLAEPGHGEPLQLQPVPRRRLVLDQHGGRVDPELRLRGPGRGASPQPGQLLAEQVLAPGGQLGRLAGPLGPGQHVRRVAAVVRVDDAVVDLPDPGADGVQEPPVVADHEHRRAAVLQRAQVLGQPVDGLDVQVVGRLVEHQQVVTAEHQRDQRRPAPFATAQLTDRAVQVDRAEQVLDQGPGPGVGGPDVIGLAGHDDVPDRRLRREVVGLVQVADRGRPRAHDPAGVGLVDAVQHPQQGRLARAVAPDDPDDVPGRDPETHLVQHEPGAVLHTHALGVHHIRHCWSSLAVRYALSGSVFPPRSQTIKRVCSLVGPDRSGASLSVAREGARSPVLEPCARAPTCRAWPDGSP